MLDTNFFWCPTNLLTAYDPPIKIDRIQVNAAILDFWLPGRVDWDLTNALLWYFMPLRMIKEESKKNEKKNKAFLYKSRFNFIFKNKKYFIHDNKLPKKTCWLFFIL